MTAAEPGSTLISVRGDATRVVDPDFGWLNTSLGALGDSRAAAREQLQAIVRSVTDQLVGLGGVAATGRDARVPLSWTASSLRTEQEFDHDEHGRSRPTGRFAAVIQVGIEVRDLDLLDALEQVVTMRDEMTVHGVDWGVDEDNPEWPLVRADAIRAALLRGRDYAGALGGEVLAVEQVADAGLLSGAEGDSRRSSVPVAGAFARPVERHGGEGPTLVPEPQRLRAVIDARLRASAADLPVG